MIINRLLLTGTMIGLRSIIYLDGTSCLLSGTSFSYLVRMAAARIAASDGWISRMELGHGNDQLAKKYLYKLRLEVCDDWPVYESDGYKQVRLLVEPKKIRLDHAIKYLPDAEIRAAIEQIRKCQAKGRVVIHG
jgi:hypothetical protein